MFCLHTQQARLAQLEQQVRAGDCRCDNGAVQASFSNLRSFPFSLALFVLVVGAPGAPGKDGECVPELQPRCLCCFRV